MADRPPFPGAIAASHLRVYDTAAPDGLAGGTPHLHTACTEAYWVVAGSGSVQTLTTSGYEEVPLEPGAFVWFTPGTIHRLVNGGDLEILVLMQNAGLPEAGDAVFTFPDEVLADPSRYAAAAALPSDSDEDAVATAARRRRDLALEGYASLRERVVADGPVALEQLYARAGALVAANAVAWRSLWEGSVRAGVEETDRVLAALARGEGEHLRSASVHVGERRESTYRYGMCGRLRTWDVAALAG